MAIADILIYVFSAILMIPCLCFVALVAGPPIAEFWVLLFNWASKGIKSMLSLLKGYFLKKEQENVESPISIPFQTSSTVSPETKAMLDAFEKDMDVKGFIADNKAGVKGPSITGLSEWLDPIPKNKSKKKYKVEYYQITPDTKKYPNSYTEDLKLRYKEDDTDIVQVFHKSKYGTLTKNVEVFLTAGSDVTIVTDDIETTIPLHIAYDLELALRKLRQLHHEGKYVKVTKNGKPL
jgi:hypothetical protein